MPEQMKLQLWLVPARADRQTLVSCEVSRLLPVTVQGVGVANRLARTDFMAGWQEHVAGTQSASRG